MKAREFVRKYVIPAGGVLEKRDGDHHVFRFPNGATFDVPMGGKQSEAQHWLLPKLRRLLRGGASAAVVAALVVVVAVLVNGCSAPFVTESPVGDDAGPDAVSVGQDAAPTSEASAMMEAAPTPDNDVVTVDAGGDVVDAGHHDDAHAALPEASPTDGAVDAAPDVVPTVDAAPDVDAGPSCADDLSNIGAGDFHISFDMIGAAGIWPLLEQRGTCGQYDVHWVVAESNGNIVCQFYDGTTGPTLQSVATVNDGAWHHVVVARVSRTFSITIDGHLDNSLTNVTWSPPSLPTMQVGQSACCVATTACSTPFAGQIKNDCVTRS